MAILQVYSELTFQKPDYDEAEISFYHAQNKI